MSFVASFVLAAETSPHPIVGAIRWDAWTGGEVTRQVERSLGPAKYHTRLPWFAKVGNDGRVRIDGSPQSIMDQEIAFASAAGLDYWAFLLYPESASMSQSLKNYLSSAQRDRINFCLILHNSFGVSEAQWPRERERAVSLLKEPGYQTVLGRRPLVYAFWDKLPAQRFAEFQRVAQAAGISPYCVYMGWNPASDFSTASAVGFHAVSAYAYGSAEATFAGLCQAVERHYWQNALTAKVPFIPLVTAGWDKQPRKENPVSWEKDHGYHHQTIFPATATPQEIASHLDRSLQFVKQNPEVCAANAIIIYAWNEHDEGGWLVPTWTPGGGPNTARLEAIGRVLKRDHNPLTPSTADATGRELFAKPSLVEIKLTLSSEAQDALRKRPREWVTAEATIDSRTFPKASLHLKGNTSFMSLDKKPSFTLKFGQRDGGGNFQGLRRMHLNNSVQDSTYLNDYLASELFRRVHVPSARTAWAKVRLNDRDLGLYVMKEHMDAEFLARFFKDATGNFYDGGLHRDINEALLLDSGSGPTNHADLVSLYDTTQIVSPAERWPKLRVKLDVDRFISMMAMEALTCDVDGYSLMQNNYRIYFDPSSQRAVFIVHGLDRMFEQINLPLEPAFRGIVSRAILNTPEGRTRYRQQLADLAEKHFQPEWITNRIEQVIRLLEPAEPLVAAPARALAQRVVKRAEIIRTNLKEQRFH